MIVFNREDIANFNMHGQVQVAGVKKEEDEWKAFNALHPYPFYSPSFFVRLGLFLLSLFIIALVFALLWLVAGSPSSEMALGILSVILGGTCLLFAGYFAKKRKHYQSGIDEALHCSIVIFSMVAAGSLFSAPVWLALALGAIVSVFLYLRFLSALMAGFAVVLLFISLSMFLENVAPAFIFSLLLTFAALGVYYFLRSPARHFPAEYSAGLRLAAYCLLACAIFFSNYFCVKTLDGFGFPDQFFKILYRVTTVLFPLILLLYAIKWKDIVALHISIIAILFAVYAVYVFTGSTNAFEWMTIFGALLSVIVVVLMNLLKNERNGFVYSVNENREKVNWIEVLIAANAPSAKASSASGFGGGDFGGGGASGNF